MGALEPAAAEADEAGRLDELPTEADEEEEEEEEEGEEEAAEGKTTEPADNPKADADRASDATFLEFSKL